MDEIVGEIKQVEDVEEEQGGVYDMDTLYNNNSPIELKINKEEIDRSKMKKSMKKLESKVEKYFIEKNEYEKKIKAIKRNIRINDKLNNKEKTLEFKKKVKCISCKKIGGTLFTIENNFFKKKCNASDPCSLNVEIKRIVFDNLVELERKYNTSLNDVKKQLVLSNMDLTFEYKSEEEAIELFNKTLNVSLKKSEKELESCSSSISSILNRNKQDISDKMNSLKDEISGLNKDHNPIGGVEVERIGNVEKYVKTILPLLNELRKLKYSYSGTECESSLTETPCSESTDDIYMIQLQHTIKDMEVQIQ